MNRLLAILGLVTLVTVAAGCPKPAEPPAITLPPISIVVLDDAPLAAAIQRELAGRLDREANVQGLASAELMSQPQLRHDLIIYPPRLMGELIDRQWIDPLLPATRDDEDLDLADVFTAIRQQELRWANQVYGVPLGSPVPVLIARGDLLEELGLEIPVTWQQYAQAVETIRESELLSDENSPLNSATLEPMADRWLPMLLYARAAAYVKHPDNLSLSLDLSTGEALIGTAGFVRAAQEMQAIAETIPAELQGLSPGETAAAALRGETVLAIGWIDSTTETEPSNLPLVFAALPGSNEVFDVANDRWQSRDGEVRQVGLISSSGMIGSVSSLSGQTVEAANVLALIAGRELTPLVSPQGTHTTLYRNSSVPAAEAWVGDRLPRSVAHEYGQRIAAELDGLGVIAPLRIAGRAEYEAALRDGLRRVLDGEQAPQASLREVAEIWDEITNDRGRDRQRSAYRASLGIRN